jgi:hypothetical protein
MIEGAADFLSEELMMEALSLGILQIITIIKFINIFINIFISIFIL